MIEVLRNSRGKVTQDFPTYNLFQVNETEDFIRLLFELCQAIDIEDKPSKGRPRLPLRDAIYALIYKVYAKKPARRVIYELRLLERGGYIRRVPHYTSISTWLRSPEITALLTSLVELTSLPFAGLEEEFAIDSTGLSTGRYARWLDVKENLIKERREWIKLHIMSARHSKSVVSLLVTPSNCPDTKVFNYLLETGAINHVIDEVSADKAYFDIKNVARIVSLGGQPFIAVKRHATLEGTEKSTIFKRMISAYLNDCPIFFASYFKRNNVETTFSMIKNAFSTRLWSNSPVGQLNEAICKVICHNLRVLARERYRQGLEVRFEDLSSYLAKVESAKPELKSSVIAGGRLHAPARDNTPLSASRNTLVPERFSLSAQKTE